jgi:Cd2+/Zn2+-exporting ATPase
MTDLSEVSGKGCGHDQSSEAQHSRPTHVIRQTHHVHDHGSASHGIAGHACGSHDCGHQHYHSDLGGEAVQLGFAVAAASLLIAAVTIQWLSPSGLPALGPYSITQLLLAGSFFFGGFFTTIDAVIGLRARRFQIDFLMIVAALGAAYIGHVAEGALLLVLFSLGHAAEHYALGRAQRSIEGLAKLRPTSATLWDEASGQTQEVAIEALQIGDTVVVRPDSRIAADGVVVYGESSVDQSAVTGESVPVDKLPLTGFDPSTTDWQALPAQHKLFAGTINGEGAMRLRVTRTAEDMTLARVMRMVQEARTHRSPTQRLTEQFERYFVPAVLGFVILLLFAFVVIDEPFSRSLYRAIAVLVAASPCALALATPSAVLSAVARGGRDGVLFKGGGPLEQLGQVHTIALDKTGTLTVGKPRVVDVITATGITRSELLSVAAAVEALSDHPLARAIVDAAESEQAPTLTCSIEEIHRVTGRGIRATVDGNAVWVGNLRMFSEPTVPAEPAVPAERSTRDKEGTGRLDWRAVDGVSPPLIQWVIDAEQSLKSHGRSTMIVCRGTEFLGVIGLMDVPRAHAAAMVAELSRIGIGQVVMLSGDNQLAAQAIADQVGIDQVFGDLSPEDKLNAIEKLMQNHPVAMIGDGVNDAPALAAATVSVAMGAAGSDVALETADVALMADDLSKLPLAVSLSRQASRVIRQNLWISLGMIAILVPASLMGLQLAVAVVFHEGSTLLVVANALRLLAYQPPPKV